MNDPTALECSVHAPSLFDTRDGRVVHCSCCGRIQIDFRGMSFLIDRDEFETLLGTVVRVLDELEGQDDATWRVSAATDAGDVSVVLNVEELQALYELLAGVQAMGTLRERLSAIERGVRRERPAHSWPR